MTDLRQILTKGFTHLQVDLVFTPTSHYIYLPTSLLTSNPVLSSAGLPWNVKSWPVPARTRKRKCRPHRPSFPIRQPPVIITSHHHTPWGARRRIALPWLWVSGINGGYSLHPPLMEQGTMSTRHNNSVALVLGLSSYNRSGRLSSLELYPTHVIT